MTPPPGTKAGVRAGTPIGEEGVVRLLGSSSSSPGFVGILFGAAKRMPGTSPGMMVISE
jgi:hypothetical protein